MKNYNPRLGPPTRLKNPQFNKLKGATAAPWTRQPGALARIKAMKAEMSGLDWRAEAAKDRQRVGNAKALKAAAASHQASLDKNAGPPKVAMTGGGLGEGNPYHDRAGKFTTKAEAVTGTGPSAGAGKVQDLQPFNPGDPGYKSAVQGNYKAAFAQRRTAEAMAAASFKKRK
jgi:hypothetical protein